VASSATGFNLALLEERQLFAEKEILRRQRLVGTDREANQPDQVEGDPRRSPETVRHGASEQRYRHER